ncbi:ABC transporter ATP-binding protein [Microbaculum marinisediminis]|uniref:ABC transporter ATP-binding protein n=1 Tax=Microbaculum marinisediminis TaxID=2931392 RepID=A0AAW5R5C0_9HYPH|nr:ABC transporter ATP-binding protein [Microbaculum sp. A6E488]MCT8974108.1 ABC transporter ATP-binding protein [Microbaculum sp. A6E488]
MSGADITDSDDGPLLEARGITKHFGTVIANDTVDLVVREGEIHALLGENGAGKSTLVKILYGILEPNGGDVLWRGRPVRLRAPSDAQALGIGMVFQHFSLFEALTVAENIALALPKGTPVRDVASRVREISRDYGLPLDPNRHVYSLSVGERQRIEIVRCLMQNPRLIIMDEPTAVLTPQEADKLFDTLVRLATEGCAILYISHRLEEVKRICSTATVLRRGKVVATCDPGRETAATLARMMVGADIAEVKPPGKHELGPVRLKVDRLSSTPEDPLGTALRDISFEVRGGEILGIAGVAGNGQEELFQALAGIVPASRPDTVTIDGNAVGRADINARRKLGAAFAPEERIGEAAVARFKLSDNVLLSGHATEHLVGNGIINSRTAKAYAAEIIQRFDVRVGSPDPEAGSLSGGNLQKFVVGREMRRDPGVFVLSQPTWGVDAGAAAVIRQALIDLAAAGSAVVVISQDLDEIFQIADSIAAISHGRLSAAHPARDMSMEKVGLLMGGVHASEPTEDSDAA